MIRRISWASLVVTVLVASASCARQDEWINLFDGKTLNGWRVAENPDSFKVEDGAIVCNGPRAHLFYVGDDGNAAFKNFEFEAEVRTEPGSNSGIYIHTSFQDSGWPKTGYEAQVLNSNRAGEESDYAEHKMTGSLYAIRNIWKPVVPDNDWFNYRILVQGKTIRIYINEELLVDYTEPAEPFRPEGMEQRLLSTGTFALQAHDPGSRVAYRNLRVRPLADDLSTPGEPLDDPELARTLIEYSAANIPLADLHVHLKGGLTAEKALENARKYGFTYGFAVNCGLDMTIPSEAQLKDFLTNYKRIPEAWLAMQAEGREWQQIFEPVSIARFDYVFTDAMTWTNDQGKRMRLWIPDEVEVGEPQQFMGMLVDRIENILNSEPINIYVNPTYLPEEIAAQYDELWTPERMDRVINALTTNGIALEINDARKLPSANFIKRAKAAGVKFTFGTNNAGKNDLGHLAYPLEMVKECGLESADIWLPKR